jgi:ankyrin repeat protein
MEIIKYLRDKGADINRYSEIGRTALSKACFLGRRDIVEFLINCKEINLKCSDKKGRTPLHNAVFGPKGGREAHKFGTCESDSPECAILLLEKGVDANETDNDLNNGLHIALSS